MRRQGQPGEPAVGGPAKRPNCTKRRDHEAEERGVGQAVE